MRNGRGEGAVGEMRFCCHNASDCLLIRCRFWFSAHCCLITGGCAGDLGRGEAELRPVEGALPLFRLPFDFSYRSEDVESENETLWPAAVNPSGLLERGPSAVLGRPNNDDIGESGGRRGFDIRDDYARSVLDSQLQILHCFLER